MLDAVAEAMPHYPLDALFEAQLPGELVSHYEEWREQSAVLMLADW